LGEHIKIIEDLFFRQGQDDLKLEILLLQHPDCWDYRKVYWHLSSFYIALNYLHLYLPTQNVVKTNRKRTTEGMKCFRKDLNIFDKISK
jgi:hypothetical protein